MSDINPIKQAPVQGMTGLGGGPTSLLCVASPAAAINIVYDFTTGSKPSGWTENTLNSNFTTSWNADGNNYLIKGDAGNPLVSYPLRNNTAFKGCLLYTSPSPRD